MKNKYFGIAALALCGVFAQLANADEAELLVDALNLKETLFEGIVTRVNQPLPPETEQALRKRYGDEQTERILAEHKGERDRLFVWDTWGRVEMIKAYRRCDDETLQTIRNHLPKTEFAKGELPRKLMSKVTVCIRSFYEQMSSAGRARIKEYGDRRVAVLERYLPLTELNKVYISDPSKIGFSFWQGGAALPATYDGQYVVIEFAKVPFAIRTPHPDISLFIATADAGEHRTSGNGSKSSRLNVYLAGAMEEDAKYLFVSDHTDPVASHNALNTSHGMKKLDSGGFEFTTLHLRDLKTKTDIDLAQYSGTLYAYAWVDMNNDSKMAAEEMSKLRLVFGAK